MNSEKGCDSSFKAPFSWLLILSFPTMCSKFDCTCFPLYWWSVFFWFVQIDDDIGLSPVLAPKQKDAPKEEPADNSPLKTAPSGPAKGTPSSSKSAKSKRKLNGDDAKATNGAPPKKVKTENVGHYFPWTWSSLCSMQRI